MNALAIPTDVLPGGELINHRTACEMARIYADATAEIARLMAKIEEQTKLLEATFDPTKQGYDPFGIDFQHRSHRCGAKDAEKLFEHFKREAWGALVHLLGVRNIMSSAKRREFDQQLERGELPAINQETIISVIGGLVEQAQDFARDAAQEVFDILRPRGHWGGQYKTNNAFRVGKRVILPGRVERGYGSAKFRANYHREQELVALDGVFHLLDGQGVMRAHRGPLVSAICASPDGTGETAYFAFKCYKNGNLHLEFKRLDLVKQLNLMAIGEAVLGIDPE